MPGDFGQNSSLVQT